MHIHIGIMQALITFTSVIIVGFFWRLYTFSHHESQLAQAMAFVY